MDQFLVFVQAITPTVCDRILADSRAWESNPALVRESGNDVINSTERIGNVNWAPSGYWLEEVLGTYALSANHLRQWVDFCGRTQGREPIQLAEYAVGGHYDWHEDRMPVEDQPVVRELSVVCLLSSTDDFKGGELVLEFDGKQETVTFGQGDIIVFPSTLKHKVSPVTEGVRKTAVCWVTAI